MTSESGGLTDEILTVIRENTIAVMTDSEDQRAEWQEMLQRLIQKARGENQPDDLAFLEAIYHLTEGKSAQLPDENPHHLVLRAILAGIDSPPSATAAPAAGLDAEETPVETAAETDVPSDIMKTIRNNTVAVMTVVPEKHEEWRAAVEMIQKQAAGNNLAEDSDFFQALLDLLDGKTVNLPGDNPYTVFLRGILEAIETYHSDGGAAAGPAPAGSGITGNLINTIRENTVAVMTHMPEKREQWRSAVAQVLTQAEGGQLEMDVEFFQAVLDILDDEVPAIRPDNPHYGTVEAIRAEIAGADNPEADAEIDAMLAAVRALLTSENWTETRRVMEDNQELLLRPEVEQLFAANIQHAQEQGQTQAADMMQVHLALLRDARQLGIPAAFERLEEVLRQSADMAETDDPAVEEEPVLSEPVPTAPGLPDSFVQDVVAGLRGNAARKQQLFEALSRLHPKEAGAEALIRETQKALFGDSVDRLGDGLAAPYDALWQAIVRGVKGTP